MKFLLNVWTIKNKRKMLLKFLKLSHFTFKKRTNILNFKMKVIVITQSKTHLNTFSTKEISPNWLPSTVDENNITLRPSQSTLPSAPYKKNRCKKDNKLFSFAQILSKMNPGSIVWTKSSLKKILGYYRSIRWQTSNSFKNNERNINFWQINARLTIKCEVSCFLTFSDMTLNSRARK